MKDPILEELHATRAKLLADSGGTLSGLVARLQREESESGRSVWVPRRIQPSEEASDHPRPQEEPTPVT
jgi:hypothetical protein